MSLLPAMPGTGYATGVNWVSWVFQAIQAETRSLDFNAARVYQRLVFEVLESADNLVADHTTLSALCRKEGASWWRACQALLWHGKILFDGEEVADDGFIIHPGFVRIPWLTDLLEKAQQKRIAGQTAGKRSAAERLVEDRRHKAALAQQARAAAKAENAVNGIADSVDATPPVSANGIANSVEKKRGGLGNGIGDSVPRTRGQSLSHTFDSKEPEREIKKGIGTETYVQTGAGNGTGDSVGQDQSPVFLEMPAEWRSLAEEARRIANVPPVNLDRSWISFVTWEHRDAKGNPVAVELTPDWRKRWVSWASNTWAETDGRQGRRHGEGGNGISDSVDPPAPAKEAPAPFTGHLTAVEFDSWLGRAVWEIDPDQRRAVIRVPTRFIADHVGQKFDFALRKALNVQEIDIRVDTSLGR